MYIKNERMYFGSLMQVNGTCTKIDRVVGRMVGKERNEKDGEEKFCYGERVQG